VVQAGLALDPNFTIHRFRTHAPRDKRLIEGMRLAGVPEGLAFVVSDPMAVSRRLVAVFAADVEGYSRLMGADEVGTLKGLTERRAILDRIIGDTGAA